MNTIENLQTERNELHHAKLEAEKAWLAKSTPQNWSAVQLADDALRQADIRLREAMQAELDGRAQVAAEERKQKRSEIEKTIEECSITGFVSRHKEKIDRVADLVVNEIWPIIHQLEQEAIYNDATRLADAKRDADLMGLDDLGRRVPAIIEPLTVAGTIRRAIGTKLGPTRQGIDLERYLASEWDPAQARLDASVVESEAKRAAAQACAESKRRSREAYNTNAE
jgi:hypothetical protein